MGSATLLFRPAVLVLFLSVMVACGKSTSLPGAVYANQVAVYPSAVYDGAIGGDYSDEGGGPVTLKSQSWFFKTDHGVQRIAAFYDEHLPAATKNVNEDGEVIFTLIPTGAGEGEYVVVRINPGKVQITELYKPGARKG